MRQASKRVPDSAEKTVRDIRRATRRHHSAEEKIRIVLEGLRDALGSNSRVNCARAQKIMEAPQKPDARTPPGPSQGGVPGNPH